MNGCGLDLNALVQMDVLGAIVLAVMLALCIGLDWVLKRTFGQGFFKW